MKVSLLIASISLSLAGCALDNGKQPGSAFLLVNSAELTSKTITSTYKLEVRVIEGAHVLLRQKPGSTDLQKLLVSKEKIEQEIISKDGKFAAYVSHERRYPGLFIQNVSTGKRSFACRLSDTNIITGISEDSTRLTVAHAGNSYAIKILGPPLFDQDLHKDTLPFCTEYKEAQEALRAQKIKETERKKLDEFNNSPEGKLQRKEQDAKVAEIVKNQNQAQEACEFVAKQAADKYVLQVMQHIKSDYLGNNNFTCWIIFQSGYSPFPSEINFNTKTGRYRLKDL